MRTANASHGRSSCRRVLNARATGRPRCAERRPALWPGMRRAAPTDTPGPSSQFGHARRRGSVEGEQPAGRTLNRNAVLLRLTGHPERRVDVGEAALAGVRVPRPRHRRKYARVCGVTDSGSGPWASLATAYPDWRCSNRQPRLPRAGRLNRTPQRMARRRPRPRPRPPHPASLQKSG